MLKEIAERIPEKKRQISLQAVAEFFPVNFTLRKSSLHNLIFIYKKIRVNCILRPRFYDQKINHTALLETLTLSIATASEFCVTFADISFPDNRFLLYFC